MTWISIMIIHKPDDCSLSSLNSSFITQSGVSHRSHYFKVVYTCRKRRQLQYIFVFNPMILSFTCSLNSLTMTIKHICWQKIHTQIYILLTCPRWSACVPGLWADWGSECRDVGCVCISGGHICHHLWTLLCQRELHICSAARWARQI